MRRNGAKAKNFAERQQVPHWTDTAQNILENKDIDAVYIPTPPSSHLSYTLAALAAGKHVYLEKPMAIAEAQQICDAVSQSRAKLTVAHYRRKLPAFLKVKELLENKSIGSITLADIKILQPRNADIVAKSEENWRLTPDISGGGYFYDLAPHQIDLLYSYFGPINNACGFYQSSHNNPLVKDTVNGIIHFENGN